MGGLCLLLASCSPKDGGENGVYRASSTPIYSNAAFDADRLVGAWDQVASFSSDSSQRCRSAGAKFDRGPKGLINIYHLCVSGKRVSGAGPVAVTGPGRFKTLGQNGLSQEWWVLWVDESYRTMAIGTPSGAFGFILNRGVILPADRLKAAQEVYDFNGYDVKRLRLSGA